MAKFRFNCNPNRPDITFLFDGSEPNFRFDTQLSRLKSLSPLLLGNAFMEQFPYSKFGRQKLHIRGGIMDGALRSDIAVRPSPIEFALHYQGLVNDHKLGDLDPETLGTLDPTTFESYFTYKLPVTIKTVDDMVGMTWAVLELKNTTFADLETKTWSNIENYSGGW